MHAPLAAMHVEDMLLAADRTKSVAERTILLRRVMDQATPYLAYQVAIRGYYVHEAETLVCESKDFGVLFRFATDVPKADRNRIGKVVAELKDPEHAALYAQVLQPTEIADLQYVVALAALQPRYSYLGVTFALKVPSASIALLEDAVLHSNVEQCIYKFAKDVPGANMKNIEQYIEAHKLTLVALWLAQDVKRVNAVRMEKVVVAHGSTNECLQFATKVPFSSFPRLMRRAITFAWSVDKHDTETAGALYGFAEATKNVNQIGEIYDALVDTRWDHVAQKIAKNLVWPGKRPNVYMVQA